MYSKAKDMLMVDYLGVLIVLMYNFIKKEIIKDVCFAKKKKSIKSYTSNKKYRDGLVPFCKTCKSKQRRAKRALTTKVSDTIN